MYTTQACCWIIHQIAFNELPFKFKLPPSLPLEGEGQGDEGVLGSNSEQSPRQSPEAKKVRREWKKLTRKVA
jgi:hypothetical protein